MIVGVSLETQNGLLSLLAFKGEGNKRYRGGGDNCIYHYVINGILGAPAESSVKQDGLDGALLRCHFLTWCHSPLANELKELAREEAEIKLTLKNQSQWRWAPTVSP